MEIIERSLTEQIISAFYAVYYELGYGFLENVYQNALYKELQRRGFVCEAQRPINVYYKGEVVGKYYADILVNNCVILELKSVEALNVSHETQLMNYLKATDIEVGLLMNFGAKPEFKRKILTLEYKKQYEQCREAKYGHDGEGDEDAD